MRVMRDRVRLKILLARLLHELRCAGALRGAMERILQQPAAQACDVGLQIPRERRFLRLVEQRVRDLRGTGTRVGKRAPIEQLAVVRALADRRVERIAGVPGRTLIEMRTDLGDARDQVPCAWAIDARTRRTLISPRIAFGNPSISAAASLSFAAFRGEPASADA